MVNYTNAKVYLIEPIEEHDEKDVYVGCTTEKFLSNRMNAHRNAYKCFKNDKYSFVSVFDLFDKFGVENCKIELIEQVSCLSRDELMQKEGHYIRTLPCVNKYISGRTQKEYQKEYYRDNKKQILEYNKQYYDDNKEKINKYKKEYYDDNKNKILENQKQYNDLNKEKINQYQKQYRVENKEKIQEQQNEKNNCICGGNFTNAHKQEHLRSLKHRFFIDFETWKYKYADVMHQIFENKLFFNCYCKSESII